MIKSLLLTLIALCPINLMTKNGGSFKYRLDFCTHYNQFYLYDKGSPGNTGSTSFWTAAAHHDRMALEDGIIGVGTQCYGHVNAELVLLADAATKTDFSKYDHVVEGGMETKSGILQILECPTSKIELTIKIRPGRYRVRVYSSNLATVIGDDGDDRYKIEVWSDNNLSRKVLKQYVNKK